MDCINEESSALYVAYLRDPEGEPVTLAQLTGLELTLFDPDTGAIVNGRDDQNALNANDVTVEDVEDGEETIAKVSWQIQPEDTVIVDGSKLKEKRSAHFKFVWDGGQVQHVYEFQVKNLQHVPVT